MTAPARLPVALPHESVSERIKGLQDQTQALAAEHVKALLEVLERAERLASEITDMKGLGDPFSPGARETARQARDGVSGWILGLKSQLGRR